MATMTPEGRKVVILGWIGSKTKHLKRLVEWYNSRGFEAVTFVVEVSEVVWFDLGSRVEKRIGALADDLAHWVSENGTDHRSLIFHTFSNTGWLVYGAILDNFQGRHNDDSMGKIRGCIVDSGGGDSLNPKVWAAGLYAALLKNRSRATTSEVREPKGLVKEKKMMQVKEAMAFEIVLLFVLEKFCSYFLSVSIVHRKLTELDSFLSKHQPTCPQLYLYSTADTVIPFCSVESRMKEQMSLGTKVHSYNFGSSPHVGHHITFPDMYTSLLDNFLKECLPKVLKETPTPISSL